jgi:pentatricopeptide repeat protein
MAGYVQWDKMAEAQEMFNRMPQRDVVPWNIMVSGYARRGDMMEARRLFDAALVRESSHGQQLCLGTHKMGCLKRPGRCLMPCQRRMLYHGMQ